MTAVPYAEKPAGTPARMARLRDGGTTAIAAMFRAARAALATWRERRRAISHLRRLSDAQLRDLGITRLEIERAVHGGAGSGRSIRGRHP